VCVPLRCTVLAFDHGHHVFNWHCPMLSLFLRESYRKSFDSPTRALHREDIPLHCTIVASYIEHHIMFRFVSALHIFTGGVSQ
jgi:hypothetical protein